MPDHKTVTFDASQWQLVPKKPTQDMVTAGFESEPDEAFSEPKVWEAFEKLSGCQQAAHKATLCYRAMLEHAPTPAAQSAGQEAVFTLRKRGDDFDVTNITPGYSALPEGEYALYAAPVNGGERECGNADCGWVGPTSETVHPKHDRSTLLCPRCHETTESNAADAQQSFLGKWSDTIKQMPMGAADAQQACSPFKCDAAQRDGVLCADDECDRANGVRPADAQQVVAQPAHEQAARFAIDGAISYGMQGVHMPPDRDHWLTEYWEIGRKLAALSSPAKAGGDEPSDAEIERLALEHIAPHAKTLFPDKDYKETEQFRRVKAYTLAMFAARSPLSADGGDRKDAERYRIVRHKVCIVGDAFHIINLRPTYVAPDAGAELDAVVDAIAAKAKGDA
ncbi:hypothetical protein [Pandoraea apista]|uniref:hypothetical protein n=1 Tax=Pandoraea apista TaxID=93218 RepID=UPI00065874F0|nr:hypothetical protein [Pandoraea apista]ALS64916.1 hypothetical protein AT395_07900 [Pandoraea apista]CFB65287.1 hypothetical protein LMG16407_04785 [Pandoraea apista]